MRKVVDHLRRKTIPDTLEKIGKEAVTAIKAGMGNSVKTKNNQRFLVKSYKDRKIWWMGAGTVFDGGDWKLKAKARWFEYGYRPYPKGKPQEGKGRGWRKGLRRQGGEVINARGYLSKAKTLMLVRSNTTMLTAISRNLNGK